MNMPRGSEETTCVEVHNLTHGITLGKDVRSTLDQGTQIDGISDYFHAPHWMNNIAAMRGQLPPQGVQ